MKQRISFILIVVLLFMMSLFGCNKAEDSSASTAGFVAESLEEKEELPLILETEQKTEQPNEVPQRPEEQPSETQPEEQEEDHMVVVPPKEKPLYVKIQEEVEAMPTIVKKVEYTGEKKLELLTDGALGDHFDYEIYYYGIKNFYIEVNGKTVELRDALAADPAVIDQLYAEWDRNYGHSRENGYDYMIKDGGTKHHIYSTYSALKYNSVSHTFYENGILKHGVYRDLYIGLPEMTMDGVADLYWVCESVLPPINGHGDFDYYFCESPLKYECYLYLRESDQHFMFKYSNYSNYLAQGTYTLKDNILTLKTNDPYQNVYLFRKVNNGFTFVEEGSSEISAFLYPGETEPIRTVSEGSYFELKTE